MTRHLLIAAATVLLLSSCDRETATKNDLSKNAPSQHDQSSSAPSPQERDNGPSMNPAVPPQTDSPTQRAAGAAPTQVRVELQEYEIRMPQTLPAGRNSLLVVNSGKDNHGLVIEGNGLHFATSDALTRGDSAALDVDLKPGTYQVYCPVDGHKGKGMERTITVQ